MENSISTGTKEFASTHPTRAREKDNNYGVRRVLSAGVIDQQQSAMTTSTPSEASTSETTPRSTILLLTAVKEGRGKPSSTVYRAAYILEYRLAELGIRIPRVPKLAL